MAANVTRYEPASRPPLASTTIPYVVNTVSGTMYTSPNMTSAGTPRTRRKWPSPGPGGGGEAAGTSDGVVDMAIPFNLRPSKPTFLTDTWHGCGRLQARPVASYADRSPATPGRRWHRVRLCPNDF